MFLVCFASSVLAQMDPHQIQKALLPRVCFSAHPNEVSSELSLIKICPLYVNIIVVVIVNFSHFSSSPPEPEVNFNQI